jgi:hypothetical protein
MGVLGVCLEKSWGGVAHVNSSWSARAYECMTAAEIWLLNTQYKQVQISQRAAPKHGGQANLLGLGPSLFVWRLCLENYGGAPAAMGLPGQN